MDNIVTNYTDYLIAAFRLILLIGFLMVFSFCIMWGAYWVVKSFRTLFILPLLMGLSFTGCDWKRPSTFETNIDNVTNHIVLEKIERLNKEIKELNEINKKNSKALEDLILLIKKYEG